MKYVMIVPVCSAVCSVVKYDAWICVVKGKVNFKNSSRIWNVLYYSSDVKMCKAVC
jgi:hypothetical protein